MVAWGHIVGEGKLVNLKRLLWMAILLPSAFVVGVTLVSLVGHDVVGWENVTHA